MENAVRYGLNRQPTRQTYVPATPTVMPKTQKCRHHWLLPLVGLIVSAAATQADSPALVVSDWFAPHMVLQRGVPIPVYGEAPPDTAVQVYLVSEDRHTGQRHTLATTSTTTAPDGQWQLALPAQPASTIDSQLSLEIEAGTASLTIEPVLVGDLWLCAGQSNMNFLMRPYLPWSEGVLDWQAAVAAAGDPLLTVFTVIPEADWQPGAQVHGTWRPDSPTLAEYFSAVPYLLGRELRLAENVPIGVVVAALGGTSIQSWMHIDALQQLAAAQPDIALHTARRDQYAAEIDAYYTTTRPAYRLLSKANQRQPTYAPALPDPYPNWRHQPAGLYHAMLAPLERIPVTGVAWYQGESDSTKHATYADYLLALIDSWRGRRNQPALPFLVVQIANHDPVLTGSDPAVHTNTKAALREAQTAALRRPATALIVTADVGNPIDIHPRDKATVAARLARAARHLAYERTEIHYTGPVVRAIRLSNSQFAISFEPNASDWLIDDQRASGGGPDFEIAAADGVFVAATHAVEDGALQVWSDQIAHPFYLRYAYHNDPKLIVYDSEGLPLAPFRYNPPLISMADFDFEASQLTPTRLHWAIRAARLTPGPGLTATGFNTSRGTPPPSFFVRSTVTPDSFAAALAADAFIELEIQAHTGYRFSMENGGLLFDIARSTTTGEFGYAVCRVDADVVTPLAINTITTSNEQFGAVRVPVTGIDNAETAVVRIYLWDNLNDSLRVARIDSVRLQGELTFNPALSIRRNAQGSLDLRWFGVPGRTYHIYSDDTLPFAADRMQVEHAQALTDSGAGHHQLPIPTVTRFYAVGESDSN
jgi:sialate O-acetylesterase